MENNVLSSDSYSRLQHSSSLHKNYVVVNWCMGNTCNYACSYCPESLHSATQPWPSFEDVKPFLDKVIEHYSGKNIYFELTGGEVSLWKDLPLAADYLKSRGCKIGIISNGSRSLEFFGKLVEKIDHICLSFHPESAKEEHFYSVVEFFAQRVRTHVNFMMKPDLFNKCLAFSLKVKNIPNISIAVQPLMEGLSGAIFNYTELQQRTMNNQHDLIVKHIKYNKEYEVYRGAMEMLMDDGQKQTVAPQNFIAAGQNSWKNWYCYAGLEQIVVDMNGAIFRGWCLAGGPVGNIYDADLKLPTKPIKCPVDKCHCNLDIMSTKVKNLPTETAMLESTL